MTAPAPQYTPSGGAEILTRSGEYFQFEDDDCTAGLDIKTIAHALALTNRFGGHTPAPYSVAEHSVRVSWICDPEDALWGLLHDAGEAYLNDIVRPAKTLLPDYQALEHRVLAKIARHYGLELPIPDSVHRADLVMCATEARDMLHGDAPAHWNLPYPPLTQPCDPWDWHLARARFLARYHELIDQER